MDVVLRPSRNRRLLLLLTPPLLLPAAIAAAWVQSHPWPLMAVPLILWSVWCARTEPLPQRLVLRRRAVVLEHEDGSRETVQIRSGARVTALALMVPIRDSNQRRRTLTLWRDALDEVDYRRLARRCRADRWPRGEAIRSPRSAREI